MSLEYVSQKVFFDNFPSELDRPSLVGMFSKYARRGRVLSILVQPTAQNTQYGMVTFEELDDARNCLRGLNGCQFEYWENSNNFRTYVLQLTLSGPLHSYDSSEYFTPFCNSGRKRSNGSSTSSYCEGSPTSSYGSRGTHSSQTYSYH